MTIKGIDVSAYQSATYDTTGLDFVFTKITEGLTYTNPRWVAQRDHAKSKGLVWGAYHYPHMANDPVQEANYFLKQVSWQPGDIIVLDWEGYDSANKGVPKSRQLAYRDAWLKYVKGKMPGHRVGMYCNTDYWLNVDTSSNCGDFLWIATGGKPAGKPGIKAHWFFHQYSTAGDVDHDVANFDSRAALAAWTDQEDDMPSANDVAKAVLTLDGVISVPGAPPTNPTWTLSSCVTEILKRVDQVKATEAAQTAAIAKLASLIGSGVDTATVVDAVQKAISDAVVKVSVDVTGPGTGV
ncbi:glycoside hydrolase family 25 protein [Streptomyces mirabilis]|uniref:glycoside hydrolase family 25 protein n=1 Tax=Streptomyces mirabilis TaxID=68239 RepID=UPI00369DBA4D